MKGSIQDYYKKLVSLQNDNVKRILIKKGLTDWDKLSPLLPDREREYVLNGYSKGMILRTNVFFRKIVAIARKRPNSKNVEVVHKSEEVLDETVEMTIDVQTYFEELRSALSVRAINVLYANGLYNYEDFLRYILSDGKQFISLRNCGRKTASELEVIAAKLKEKTDEQERERVEGKVSFINRGLDDLYLSARTYNCLRSAGITTLEEIATSSERDILKLKNFGKKSLDELNELLSTCNLHFGMNAGEYQLIVSPEIEEISSNAIIYKVYPLYEEELKDKREFAIQFESKYGHLPVLRMLYDCLGILTRWESEVAMRHWGMYRQEDNLLAPQTFKEISEKVDVTEFRIEQIFNSAMKRLAAHACIKMLLQHDDWKHYLSEEERYYLITEEKLKKIQLELNEELPHTGIPFWCAMLQLYGMKPYWIDIERKELFARYSVSCSTTPYLFVDGALKKYDFCKAIREVQRLSKIKKTNSFVIPISSYFIDNEKYWIKGNVPSTRVKECVAQVLKSLFVKICEVKIDNNQVTIEANKVDYGERLYEILKISGDRLHRDELLDRLKKVCHDIGMDCEFTDSMQISTFLTKDPRIVPVGKSGFWELKEWGNKDGSIREIALGIMRKSRVPIHINELCEMILKRRPDSNMNSVTCVVRQAASAGELLLFYDDLIGYPKKKYEKDHIIMPQSFDEWLQAYKSFIEKNRRLPYSNQDYEGYLYRWHYRSSQLTDLTPEEILKLDALEKEVALYPQNYTEYNFLQNCNLYRKFVEGNKRKLTKEDDSVLFNWFYAASRNYSTYNDNRNKYFSQLLQALSSILY